MQKLNTFHSIGTSDYRKELCFEGWAHCYIQYCCKAPALYPEEFDIASTAILCQDLYIEQSDINIHNAKNVYSHLLHIFST